MNKNQKGIALVETLLIILILAIIGFGGYYVWHTQKQTDNTLNQASTTSQQTASLKPAQKFLIIKEWSVRIPYTGSDTFTYKSVYDDPDNASKANPNLIAIVSINLATKYSCTDSGAGLVSRHLPTEQVASPTDATVGESAAQAAAQDPSAYVKVSGYYYNWAHDQSACSETVTAAAQNQASTAFEGYFKHIQATPQ